MSDTPKRDYQEMFYDVGVAIPTILATATAPLPTRVLATKVARIMDPPEKDVARVSKVLLNFASNHPAARKDGREFSAFGKRQTGWTWMNRNGSAPAVPVAVEATPPMAEEWSSVPATAGAAVKNPSTPSPALLPTVWCINGKSGHEEYDNLAQAEQFWKFHFGEGPSDWTDAGDGSFRPQRQLDEARRIATTLED